MNQERRSDIMRSYERLLKYVVIRTPSDENSKTVPSSECQFNLARLLVQELKDLGVSDAKVDEHGYVYAHLPPHRAMKIKQRSVYRAYGYRFRFCDHDIIPIVT